MQILVLSKNVLTSTTLPQLGSGFKEIQAGFDIKSDIALFVLAIT